MLTVKTADLSILHSKDRSWKLLHMAQEPKVKDTKGGK